MKSQSQGNISKERKESQRGGNVLGRKFFLRQTQTYFSLQALWMNFSLGLGRHGSAQSRLKWKWKLRVVVEKDDDDNNNNWEYPLSTCIHNLGKDENDNVDPKLNCQSYTSQNADEDINDGVEEFMAGKLGIFLPAPNCQNKIIIVLVVHSEDSPIIDHGKQTVFCTLYTGYNSPSWIHLHWTDIKFIEWVHYRRVCVQAKI